MSLSDNLRVLMKSKAIQKDLVKRAQEFKIRHARAPTEVEAAAIARLLIEKHTGKSIEELEKSLDKKEQQGGNKNECERRV